MLVSRKIEKCGGCGLMKPIPRYSRPDRPGTRKGACVECREERRQSWLDGLSEEERLELNRKQNTRRFLREYGLTKEQILAMLDEQDGKCLICQEIMEQPHVDHNHVTGEVRGLLCPQCNMGLGLFKDDPLILAAAIRYVGGEEINGWASNRS